MSESRVLATGNDLVPFVPRLATDLGAGDGPRWVGVDGSMLSADISGFTALSEKLAGKGKAGAEEITALMNTCFTGLIDAAYGYGGEVVKFGGDALLVLFRGEDHRPRAANAALAMQTSLHAAGAARRARLTMTVGASHGPFDVFVAGSRYREILVTGPAATRVIHLEGEADKGETLVSEEIAAELPASALGRRHAGGIAIAGDAVALASPPVERDPSAVELHRFVPPAVTEQLAAFAELGGEHRIVTVGFLMVTGASAVLDVAGPQAAAAAFHQLVDDVMAATGEYGVTLLHTDIAPDGVKFVLSAGAPSTGGDTSDAMLGAALRIAAIDAPFVLRQGVQTGRVFAGFLGSTHRRTYTLMGDAVNTAARMLGPAGDREIVAVQRVVDDTRSAFTTQPLPPFRVKGKTEPVIAHRVVAASDRMRDPAGGTQTAGIVGRTDELAILERAVESRGAVVELVGPAGVGKSTLLEAARDRVEDLTTIHSACTPYGSTDPYSLFRPMLRSALAIDVDADAPTAGAELSDRIDEVAPEMRPMLPLLAVPVGAEVPSHPEAEAIDPEFRRARTHDLVVALLDAVSPGPLVIVAEDVHWIDDASEELLDHLIGATAEREWVMILTRRPGGDWEADASRTHVASIPLAPLTAEETRRLAMAASTRALTDAELDLVIERSQGHPLFAVEVARRLDAGETDLPDSVERIIGARIDELRPGARRVARIAAVLGTTFAEEDLREVLRVESPELDIRPGELEGILTRRARGRLAFVHALYRDAAYEGLPFRQRRHLHGVVATSLEQRSTAPVQMADLLSLHFSEAHLHREAWHYGTVAGERALAQHAYAEAATAFERALQSARWAAPTTDARVRVAEVLGDAHYLLGRFEHARRSFQVARRANDDPAVEVGLMRKLGSVSEREGRADQARRWYGRAIRAVPKDTQRTELLAARAHVMLASAGIEHRHGDNRACLESARRAHADASKADDHSGQALALERMHLATVYLRLPDDEGLGMEALRAYREIDDVAGQTRTLINLGVEAYFNEDWTKASQSYLDAAELASAAGNIVLAETATLNSGEILSDQGHWHKALELFEHARRNWQAVGYSVGVAAATLFRAVAEMRSGALQTAATSLDEARGLLQDLDVAELIDDLDSRRLELGLLGDTDTVDEARLLLRRLGEGHPLEARVRRSLGLGLWRNGELADAAAELEAAWNGTTPGSFERGLTAAARALVDADASAKWTRAADVVFARLDVALPPPLVG